MTVVIVAVRVAVVFVVVVSVVVVVCSCSSSDISSGGTSGTMVTVVVSHDRGSGISNGSDSGGSSTVGSNGSCGQMMVVAAVTIAANVSIVVVVYVEFINFLYVSKVTDGRDNLTSRAISAKHSSFDEFRILVHCISNIRISVFSFVHSPEIDLKRIG